MKILHILDHSLPLHSGYSFRSFNIFRTQLERGWQPVVLTSPKHEESSETIPGSREEIEGITYYRTGKKLRNGYPLETELRMMHCLARRIREVAEIEKPDVLHAHSPLLNAIPALYTGRKLGIPVVYEIRAFWEDAAVDHGTCVQDSIRYKLIRSLETWVCHKVDHVGILCDGLKNSLADRGIPREKITLVPNGVNADDFKACEPDGEYLSKWQLEGKTVIGFIGSFYRYEGLDLLVEAFSRVCTDYPHAVLLLVGGGETEPMLKAQIAASGLTDRVVMPGRIPHGRVPGVYALIDVLVYPRRPMPLTELVTPLKPLEAMAMGKALVASNVGGHRELIEGTVNGLLFPAGDVGAMAASLKQLMSDRQLRERLQAEGPKWVREHRTWEIATRPYGEIYERVLALGRSK